MGDIKIIRDFKGIWIPKEIWLSSDLTLQEKVLFVEIDSLDNEKHCYATNSYFANFFGISKDRASKVIQSLVVKGFLKLDLIYKKGSMQVEKRVLTIIKHPTCKSVYSDTPTSGNTGTLPVKVTIPTCVNTYVNNTTSNTVNSTNKNNKKDIVVPTSLNKNTNLSCVTKQEKGTDNMRLFDLDDVKPIVNKTKLFPAKYKDFSAVKNFCKKVDNTGKWSIGLFTKTDWLMGFILTYNKYSDHEEYKILPQGTALNALVTPFYELIERVPIEMRQHVFEDLLKQNFSDNCFIQKWRTGFVLDQFINEKNRVKVIEKLDWFVEMINFKNNDGDHYAEEKKKSINNKTYVDEENIDNKNNYF